MKKAVILCVDDDLMVLNSLEIQLKNHFKQQYFYEFAQSGEEGLYIVDELDMEEVKVIVVVSDWLMPGMKGDEFLVRIHNKFPQIITVMLTGEADEQAIRRAEEEANLFSFVNKPWDGDKLMEVIERGIQEYTNNM